MRTPRPRKPTPIQSTYVESWACLKYEARFITFCTGTDLFVAHRPDQIACPYCHYMGRVKHWQAELNPASRLGDYFPWPDSRNLDSEDAELLQNMLALSQPSAREYYARTDSPHGNSISAHISVNASTPHRKSRTSSEKPRRIQTLRRDSPK